MNDTVAGSVSSLKPDGSGLKAVPNRTVTFGVRSGVSVKEPPPTGVGTRIGAGPTTRPTLDKGGTLGSTVTAIDVPGDPDGGVTVTVKLPSAQVMATVLPSAAGVGTVALTSCPAAKAITARAPAPLCQDIVVFAPASVADEVSA